MAQMIDPGDAFLLGYLPHLLRNFFDELEVVNKAIRGGGEGAERAKAMLDELGRREPEVASCTWHVEHLVGDRLHAQPPRPPPSGDEWATWFQGVADRFFARTDGHDPARRDAFGLGSRVGEVEAALAGTRRAAELLEADAGTGWLAEQIAGRRRSLEQMAARGPAPGSFYADEPTVRGRLETLVRAALAGAEDGADLASLHREVVAIARALESAARGTPRATIPIWLRKDISNLTLKYRLAEHRSWQVPVTMTDAGPAPRIMVFEKRVLFAFSDDRAVRERPAFLRDDKAENQKLLVAPGHTMFRWLPSDDVDVLSLDANDDEQSPLTIHIPKESHQGFADLGRDAHADLAVASWSAIGPDEKAVLRQHRYWVLVEGDKVRNLICPDGYGRPRVSVFTCEAALEKFYAQYMSLDQLRDLEKSQRLLVSGETLFPTFQKLEVIGAIFNPSGPGRTRALPKKAIAMLAEGERV